MELDGGRTPIHRKQSLYRSLDDNFTTSATEKYRGQQYSQIYFCRLHHMRNLIHALIPNWMPNVPVNTVLGLEGKECIIIGTLYKHMKFKPSILDEYAKERSAVPLVHPQHFTHLDDYLVLEDESGRVQLANGILVPAALVTGIVVALHGKETSDGNFLVHDILEAGLAPQKPLPLQSEDKYVVLVSGLSVGGTNSNPLQIQLVVDHIAGHLGDEKTLASKDFSKLSEPIKELDILLTQLAAAMPVDIMPGPHDPANFSLPQQPLHRCLFPGASAYNTFVSSTNPHLFELDDVVFLGTSGQNIDDLDKYSEAKDKLEFLERTLQWRHLAPTAPNTLGCYPFTDRDPFLVKSCPHVYFVGNQTRYETRLLQGSKGQIVRLICIPRFCETGVAIMVNLRNLECHTLSFSTSLDL